MTDNSSNIKLLMVGIGGYGNRYLQSISEQSEGTLTAIVDPMPEKAPLGPELMAQGMPIFPSIQDFLASGIEVDLAIVSSPISFHAEQSCALMKAGIDVLCEKPIAATVEDAEQMRQTRDETGRLLEIGYQWCFSEAIQDLKKDIIDGVFGAAKTLMTRVEWSRNSAYYSRNNWAGCILNKQGQTVNDSPVGNATAHYLNNMLYILGEEINQSTRPKSVSAECYRANPIENYDTACCRIKTEAAADILFYTTHAVPQDDGPVFKYIFEHAEIDYSNLGDIIATFADGRTKNYGNPDADRMRKLAFCIRQCRAKNSRESICSVESATALTLCVEALQKVKVTNFDDADIVKQELEDGQSLLYVPSLPEAIHKSFEQQKLFSELGELAWARTSSTVTIP